MAEYLLTWPQRSDSLASELIEALSGVIEDAVRKWSNGSLRTTSIDAVNEQITDLIVAKQYVIFHHYETTRRDFGGFHSAGYARARKSPSDFRLPLLAGKITA